MAAAATAPVKAATAPPQMTAAEGGGAAAAAANSAASAAAAADAINVEVLEPLTDIDGRVLSSKFEIGEETADNQGTSVTFIHSVI